jgi:23S rRNA (cytidine1920-2'-O)/16S rRNA (cytidine1409-2'-O)-methyltransferase
MGSKSRLEKDRLDHLLVTQGLAQSRDAAVRMILAGEVRVGGLLIDKPSRVISVASKIEVRHEGGQFVGRGGEKLNAALDRYPVDLHGAVCLDIGASTGGFTDCLLKRGAARVHAIDVGYGQLDWKLRQDSRVVVHERVNARYLDRSIVPEEVDLVVIDVSFISLTMILPPVVQFLRPKATVIALVKPQFEVGKGEVGRGGIVREEAQRQQVVQRIINVADELGLCAKHTVASPIKGKKGNQEIFAFFEFSPSNCGKKASTNLNLDS